MAEVTAAEEALSTGFRMLFTGSFLAAFSLKE
jgi:hypothetical protein